MLEKTVESKVVEYAKSKGLLPYKFSSPARAAVPDRLFITIHGTVFFIEFKRPGKEATPAQHREHMKLRDQGVRVFVIDDVDKGKSVINIMEGL